MSSREMFDQDPGGWTLAEGDTGEAILPALTRGAHSDRDASEAPKVNDKGAHANAEAVTKALRVAERKIVELVAHGEKRYNQWQAAETRLVDTLRELARDAKIRGDVGKEGGVEAWDYLNLYADKIERGDQ